MGNSCSNCNCNKDEHDEFRLDEKLAASQGIAAGANRQNVLAAETYQNDSSQLEGVYSMHKSDNQHRWRAQGGNNISGLEPTSTFDDHHYAN